MIVFLELKNPDTLFRGRHKPNSHRHHFFCHHGATIHESPNNPQSCKARCMSSSGASQGQCFFAIHLKIKWESPFNIANYTSLAKDTAKRRLQRQVKAGQTLSGQHHWKYKALGEKKHYKNILMQFFPHRYLPLSINCTVLNTSRFCMIL